MLQIQHENNFLPTSKHRQAKDSRFLGICLYDCFIYRSNFVFQKCLETRRHLGSGRKTVNSQGYSELKEPIKTRENCYPLIWLILKVNMAKLQKEAHTTVESAVWPAYPYHAHNLSQPLQCCLWTVVSSFFPAWHNPVVSRVLFYSVSLATGVG